MSIDSLFFRNWADVFRTVVIGTLAYFGLIVVLRVSGKRTLAKMNAFDLVVTVALGSTLATILLSKDVALAEGMTAFLTLVGLQYGIAWLSVRSEAVSRLVKAEPTLLLHEGGFLRATMRRERVTESEVRAAVRQGGFKALENVSVVLETDGSFSVVQQAPKAQHSALQGVKNS